MLSEPPSSHIQPLQGASASFEGPSPGSQTVATHAPQQQESKSQTFQAPDGVELHVLCWEPKVEAGKEAKAPVILLHGGGANAHWWDSVAIRLARNRPVYALDFRGHGDSHYPQDRFVGAFNKDLETMLSWLGREDVYLVGHSMGAAVALDHTSRFQATRGLALVDLARGGPPGGGRRARLALAHRRTYRTREDAIARYRFLPESDHTNDATRSYIAERSIRDEGDGRFGYKFDPKWFSLPSRPRPDLSMVQCKTLLIRGSDSPLLSAEAAREFVSQLRSGELIEISDAGHHVLIDQPDLLSRAIEAFLQNCDESVDSPT